MENRLTVHATDTNIVYLDTDTITNLQWVVDGLQFTIFTTTSLSIVFTLVQGFHEDAIAKILKQVDINGTLSTSTVTRTETSFNIGDNKWKSLKEEHRDNPDVFQELLDTRIKYYYDISTILFSGGVDDEGAFWEANAEGDLTPVL
mgnify:CR=1 FL=1